MKVLPLDHLGSFLVNQYGNPLSSERADGEKSGDDKSEKPEKSDKNERVPVSTPRT